MANVDSVILSRKASIPETHVVDNHSLSEKTWEEVPVYPGNLSLEQKALKKFDLLVKRGNVLYEPSEAILIRSTPFDASLFQFRIVPSFSKKPYMKDDDPGRKPGAKKPFTDGGPDSFLEFVGPKHTLIFNAYCGVRPQYLLHTNEFEKQTDLLNRFDLDAGWNVLSRLDTPHMIFYSCGIEAGSSQGHKHLQIVPLPDKKEYQMFPSVLGIDSDICTVPNIPFRHAAKKLSPNPSSAELIETYLQLVIKAKVDQSVAHGVVIVEDWMLVIPRTKAKIPGFDRVSGNAATMAGIAWLGSCEALKEWLEIGPLDVLCGLGVDERVSK